MRSATFRAQCAETTESTSADCLLSERGWEGGGKEEALLFPSSLASSSSSFSLLPSPFACAPVEKRGAERKTWNGIRQFVNFISRSYVGRADLNASTILLLLNSLHGKLEIWRGKGLLLRFCLSPSSLDLSSHCASVAAGQASPLFFLSHVSPPGEEALRVHTTAQVRQRQHLSANCPNEPYFSPFHVCGQTGHLTMHAFACPDCGLER